MVWNLIRQIVEIYGNYGLETYVLAASIRGPIHVTEAALAGAHVATIPTKVFDQMLHHPLTEKGIEGFLKDWKKSGRLKQRTCTGDLNELKKEI